MRRYVCTLHALDPRRGDGELFRSATICNPIRMAWEMLEGELCATSEQNSPLSGQRISNDHIQLHVAEKSRERLIILLIQWACLLRKSKVWQLSRNAWVRKHLLSLECRIEAQLHATTATWSVTKHTHLCHPRLETLPHGVRLVCVFHTWHELAPCITFQNKSTLRLTQSKFDKRLFASLTCISEDCILKYCLKGSNA